MRRARGGRRSSHVKRSSCSSACPSGVAPRRTRDSIAYGMPSPPSTVSSGARHCSTDGAISAICSGATPPRISADQLLADELERPARPGAFQEAHPGVEVGRRSRGLLEERALEVCERGMGVFRRPRRQLLDAPVGERREIVGGALEGREGDPARLVGQRDLHLGSTGERLEQRPLRPSQVLEAVGEDGLAVPRVEVRLQPLGGTTALEVAVPEAERGRARRGRRRRAGPGRRRGPRGRASPARARRESAAACRRTRPCGPSGRARSAMLTRAHGARRGPAGRRSRPRAVRDRA